MATRKGGEWSLRTTPYLQFSVMVDGDDAVIVTWELAIGELMGDRGLHVGTNDPLQVFLYPQHDARGPADAAFVESEITRVTGLLAGLDLTGAG